MKENACIISIQQGSQTIMSIGQASGMEGLGRISTCTILLADAYLANALALKLSNKC